MADDIVGGTSGDVTASGFNGDIDAWSAQVQTNRATWRTFKSKFRRSKNVTYWMSGQFSGTIQFNDTDTAPMPTKSGGTIDVDSFEGVDLTLTAESGVTYTGKADITAVDINRPANDRMTGTWSFEFTGEENNEPNQTWDESTS